MNLPYEMCQKEWKSRRSNQDNPGIRHYALMQSFNQQSAHLVVMQTIISLNPAVSFVILTQR